MLKQGAEQLPEVPPRMTNQSAGRLPIAAAIALVLAGSVGIAATGPMTWVQSSYDDFRAGEMVSVSLDTEGEIRLAPELGLIGDTREAFVWAVDEAADGSVYVAAGTDGRVYRFAAGAVDAIADLFFEADGAVHAMVVGPDDHLYVAASPGGAIWRLALDGTTGIASEPWFSTGTRYVWDLVFGGDGTLYAGTGDGGMIYRVETGGGGEMFYDSNETHITSLAIDPSGNILAGSSDNGHLYRVGPEGDVFVLFDSPMKQITGIVSTAAGVFFSALESGPGSDASDDESAEAGAISGSNGDSLRGAVYLLHDDGLVEQLWGSAGESPHSIEAAAPGVIVGTGSEGRLFHVAPGPATTILRDVDAAQVTALRSRGGDIIVGTSNLGRVYRLGESYDAEGEYLSRVKDTATTSRWGRVRWRGASPVGTSVRLYTRSGNTTDPDETWSGWDGPYTDASGSPIGSPPARFIQWKAELATTDKARTPVLQWVELVYVPRNLRPEIEEFTVHPAGVIYRRNTSFEDGLPIGQLPSPVRQALASQQGRGGTPPPAAGSSFLGQAYYLPGSQTFTWKTSDPNGDQMTFSLLYRGEGEVEWKPVITGISETLYLWDTTTVPDGLYRARLVATDAPSNPAGRELEGGHSSELFVVDNTAPQIDNLSAVDESGIVRITGVANDATSLIRAMEYAVDGGEWHAVLPADGLPDAGNEAIEFTTMTLEPGEHTIVVRVTDTALNSGTGRVVITVQ